METIIKEFDPVIYPRKLWVTTGDLDGVLSKFKYTDGTPIKCKDSGIYGITVGDVTLEDSNQIGILVYISEVNKPSQVMHEAIHVANKIFKDLGITFTYEDDEHYAYFVEWICDCILEVINDNLLNSNKTWNK